jgi:RNA polymerase sigma-70 factor (ECF subfamily)
MALERADYGDKAQPNACDVKLADDLERIADRDLAALNRLYHATHGKLLSICLRITRDRESAEDVLQEVYVKIWNRAAGYDRSRAKPMVWLGRLARNSAIDWYRAHARRRAYDIHGEHEVHDSSRLIDEELIEREQQNIAMALLEGLRDDQKATIREIYFEGLTYAQIAERDGVPLGTVKSRIHRTLIQLSRKWHRD